MTTRSIKIGDPRHENVPLEWRRISKELQGRRAMSGPVINRNLPFNGEPEDIAVISFFFGFVDCLSLP
jgi:hypothetical protein